MHLWHLIAAVLLFVCVSDVALEQEVLHEQQTPRAFGNAAQTTQTPARFGWQRNGSNYRQQNAAGSTKSSSCEYKDLMTTLHDRISVLATLAEDQRLRLENIDKKLEHLEANNQARMVSLSVQQMDFVKRLDSLEHIQRLTKHTMDELKEASLTRNTRQIERPETDSLISQIFETNNVNSALWPEKNTTSKLDSLAIYLTFTRVAIAELQSNVTKLLQQTSNIQRRFNNAFRRKQNGMQYLPPAGARQPSYYETSNSELQLVMSCAQEAPLTNSIVKLQLTHTSEPFYVLCETDDIYNGDWTVILKRFNGAVNFNRDWLEYKAGFGNLAGEFFIGLEKLHALTASSVHELLVLLEDFTGQKRYARYSHFAITGSEEQYALHLLGAYQGDAGDALAYHAGSKFSTFDHDNDGCLDCNCAQSRGGGWWYNWCATSNLMGNYYKQANYSNSDDVVNGIFWDTFQSQHESLKKVKMMIRPVNDDYQRRR